MGRVGGKISISVNGSRIDAVGSFEGNEGSDMREAMVGHDRPHGYKELPQSPFIEGEMRITPGLDVEAVKATTDATVTLVLASGHVLTIRNAWFAGEGNFSTEEGTLAVRFEGLSGDLDSGGA